MDLPLRENSKKPAFQNVEAGLDEAGRGCLAGPVVACAVILPKNYDLPFLADSKTLSERQRKLLSFQIKKCCVAFGFGIVWPGQIDTSNILYASLKAMALAASWLKVAPSMLLLDGSQTIHKSVLSDCWCRRHTVRMPAQTAIVKGDAKIPAISAASILAKTWRDRLMEALSKKWPDYGFEKHKGYGTKEHLAILKKIGPCRMHRLTFKGVLPDPVQASLL